MAGADVEFVVVGAGVLGLSAAHALARRDHDVVVCEQATVGHGGGGSKGAARIFRLGYDDPGYVRLAQVAYRQWRDLEVESGSTLFSATGQVTFGDDLEVLAAALSSAGAAFERMTAPDIGLRFPGLSASGPALYEPVSGVLAAADCLAALRRGPRVEVRETTRVTDVEDDGRQVRLMLETPDGVHVLSADAVVVCAGPWTAPLLSGVDVGLRPLATLEQVAYLAPVSASSEPVPVVVERRRPWFYGLPDGTSGLMKVSLHGAGPAVALDAAMHGHTDDPDEVLVAELSACARRVLPGFDPQPVATERCLYDNTPDGDFVLDRVGRVVIGAGTSGHGFKFAPLLGEILADLAMSALHHPVGSLVDLGRFSAGRLRSLGSRTGPTVHP